MGVCPAQAVRTEASGPWGSPACWGPPERSSALPSALSLPSGHLSQHSLKAKNPEVPLVPASALARTVGAGAIKQVTEREEPFLAVAPASRAPKKVTSLCL